MTIDADYLELSEVRVVFDGFVAVDGVSMTVRHGDLRFLIGPNGAGKTTLVDAITGLAPATGSVRFGRTELIGKKVHRIARLGVGRTFQTASVFEELTVLQNLDIAAAPAALRCRCCAGARRCHLRSRKRWRLLA
jgi:urea transport system ATP-binding protein